MRDYEPRPHSLRRQLLGLVEHLFVEYRTPDFLLPCCLREEAPFEAMHRTYRRWLVALGQGQSFPKQVQPYMTAREAYLFLSAPDGSRVHENVWWAKLTAAEVPVDAVPKLINRIFGEHLFEDPDGRFADVIRFYARFSPEMDRQTFGEITDCITWRLRNEPAFSMKGRTLASTVKLSAEWHRDMQLANIRQLVEWRGLQIRDWEMEERGVTWTVIELRNNRDLLNEGRTQRHCVFSYLPQCLSGKSALFSLRGFSDVEEETREEPRITFEVDEKRTIVEVRGYRNRPPTSDEMRLIRKWAADKGVHVAA